MASNDEVQDIGIKCGEGDGEQYDGPGRGD